MNFSRISPDKGRQLLRFLRVHAGGRLIQKQQLRLRRQCPGDLQPPLLAVGQAGGQLIFTSDNPTISSSSSTCARWAASSFRFSRNAAEKTRCWWSGNAWR